ncbi:MAG TPA: GAF domain-containing protein, partial [Gammaproteobacteria bacterium]|nr:GAF domain-containing protein [Gammaproteobacteria bacterium]
MKIPPIPDNEEERLKALYSYKILDTAEEKVFNTIVSLAASICDVPISSVTLIDKDRQWFKASKGFEPGVRETPREIAFCGHTILQDEFFEIKDATEDPRFEDNPSVTGAPHIVYYGGVPILNPEGYKIGTLCVIDKKPRELTDLQKVQIKYLSEIAMALMEAKKHMGEELRAREA